MVKLFTHTDLDGVGCAVLAKIAFGNDSDIEYCNYNEINDKVSNFVFDECTKPRLEPEDMCHITDISIDDTTACYINDNSEQFYLLDHHPTALELNKYSWCTVKIEDEETGLKTCGTEMYYKWLVNNGHLVKNKVFENFVNIVRDYDTWRWSTMGEDGLISKQINDLFYLHDRDYFVNWCIEQMVDFEDFPVLDYIDKFLLDKKQTEIDDYVSKKDKLLFTKPILGKTCGVVFAEKYFSELGNKLCTIHPEIDFVAMIDMDGTVSYRTVKDDIDLGKFAKIFDGGGHPKAAGSQFSEDIRRELVDKLFTFDLTSPNSKSKAVLEFVC